MIKVIKNQLPVKIQQYTWTRCVYIGKHENKDRLFELNVYFVRILIRFYTYSNDSQSL